MIISVSWTRGLDSIWSHPRTERWLAEAPAEEMTIILRILSVAAAVVTSLFVARDALNFGIIQTLVTVTLLVSLVLAIAVWSRREKT